MEDPDIIKYQHNFFKPMIDEAMNITRDYISKHKLILTGGMAIDLALREKGESIYDDDIRPDYDIISDDNLTHANALAEILCKANLPDINVISAVHITTVKVRIKNEILLDATYIPPICFKKIPYLDINDLRIIHPHYQFIDQRISLSHLLLDTGISLNVFNRLAKDMKRNMILRQMYPIQSNKTNFKTKMISIPIDLIKIQPSKLNKLHENSFIYTGSTCISGYAAYLLIMSLKNPKIKPTIANNHLMIPTPLDIPITLLSCDIPSIEHIDLQKSDKYRPLLNLKGVSLRVHDYEIVDTYGERAGCNIITIDGIDICVASIDYVLAEFLRDRIYVNEEYYSAWYSELSNLCDEMRSIDSESIWWPSLNSYGLDGLPEYKTAIIEYMLDETKRGILKPKSSYPSYPKCMTKGDFDPQTSHYFMIDGSKDNSLEHTNLKYIMDEYHNYLNKKRNEE